MAGSRLRPLRATRRVPPCRPPGGARARHPRGRAVRRLGRRWVAGVHRRGSRSAAGRLGERGGRVTSTPPLSVAIDVTAMRRGPDSAREFVRFALAAFEDAAGLVAAPWSLRPRLGASPSRTLAAWAAAMGAVLPARWAA